jgi:proteasome accessory factor A
MAENFSRSSQGESYVSRYYGSETEFGVSVRPQDIYTYLTNLHPPHIANLGDYLRNGAKNYIDYNNIPEYATGECSTLRELVIHEIRGEELQTLTHVRDPKKEDENRVAVSLHKRCITPNGMNSTGAHESYSTTVNIWTAPNKEILIGVLGSHNATRTVYTGAGHPNGETFNEDDFALAQKMLTVETVSKNATTKDKPLVNLRSEHHNGGNERLHRFHNTCGDANISPWAIKMKFGTTSILLRLLENDIDMSDIIFEDPLGAARQIAASKDNLTKPLRLNNGETASALDIQGTIIERALLHSEQLRLPKDELDVIEDWITVLDSLRSHAKTDDDVYFLKRLDWYTKWQILTGYKGKNGGLSGEKFEKVLLFYDQTKNGIGVKLRNPDGRFSIDMPSRAELDAADSTPPEGRASLRGEFIERIATEAQASENGYVSAGADWERVVYKNTSYKLLIDGDYSQDAIKKKMDTIFNTPVSLKKEPKMGCPNNI